MQCERTDCVLEPEPSSTRVAVLFLFGSHGNENRENSRAALTQSAQQFFEEDALNIYFMEQSGISVSMARLNYLLLNKHGAVKGNKAYAFYEDSGEKIGNEELDAFDVKTLEGWETSFNIGEMLTLEEFRQQYGANFKIEGEAIPDDEFEKIQKLGQEYRKLEDRGFREIEKGSFNDGIKYFRQGLSAQARFHQSRETFAVERLKQLIEKSIGSSKKIRIIVRFGTGHRPMANVFSKQDLPEGTKVTSFVDTPEDENYQYHEWTLMRKINEGYTPTREEVVETMFETVAESALRQLAAKLQGNASEVAIALTRLFECTTYQQREAFIKKRISADQKLVAISRFMSSSGIIREFE